MTTTRAARAANFATGRAGGLAIAAAVVLIPVATTQVRAAAPAADSPDTPGSARQLRLLSRMTGFAAVARTTGGLGHPVFRVDRAQDDAQPGALRWAVQQATRQGGGWIVFAPKLAAAELRLTAPIRLPSNVTLDGGVAAPALIGAAGQTVLVITRSSNVVVANLRIRSDLTGAIHKGNGDCISVAHGADRIWIANNLIGRCGDGQLDITQNGEPGRMRVTVAFNHFTAHDKVAIVQGNDDPSPCGGPGDRSLPPMDVTFYRNFFDGTGQRHPRAGGRAYVHWVENVVRFRPQARSAVEQGGAYGGAVTAGAAMLVERSLYRAAEGGTRAYRFIDTRATTAAATGCAAGGRLRTRQLATYPATSVAQSSPELVPDPPYTIGAAGGTSLPSLFAGVMGQSGPRRGRAR